MPWVLFFVSLFLHAVLVKFFHSYMYVFFLFSFFLPSIFNIHPYHIFLIFFSALFPSLPCYQIPISLFSFLFFLSLFYFSFRSYVINRIVMGIPVHISLFSLLLFLSSFFSSLIYNRIVSY